jgi:hypothetical protein
MAEHSADPPGDVLNRKPEPKLFGEKKTVDNPPAPVKLNRHASQNLLNHLAGETMQDIGHGPSETKLGKQTVKTPDRTLLDNTNGKTQRDWLQSVARRAWRSVDTIGNHVDGALDEQWTFLLDGEPAPLELLNSWMGRPEGSNNDVRSDREMKNRTRSRQPALAESIPSQPASGNDLLYNEPMRTRLPVVGWRSSVESEWIFSERIAPPAVAPSLPRLLPPQGASEPAPALAAQIARQDARQEAMRSEDDLAGLAANIKRILDEEARRHGIDV